MSHYEPYPAYKDSGVEWLARVPEHWQVKQLKYLASHIGSGKTPSGGAEVYQDAGVLFLRSQNVYEGGLRLDDAAFISEEVDEEMKGSRVMPGDVLLNITGASIGRSCQVPEVFERANVNQHVCIIRGESPVASKWISLCLPSKAVQAQIDFSQNGAGREGLNFEQIGNMLIALPHAEEVDEIASHLDRETSRIDALIEKKTRFIELLREKRQALITHAVTKGLDPSVKMKGSGVEWLGEVPEHWSKPMSLLSLAKSEQHSFVNGPFGSDLLTTELTTEGVPVIYIRDIRASAYRRVSEVFVSPEKAEQLQFCNVLPGDVVISKVGDPPGIAAVYPVEEQDGIVTQDVMRLRVDERQVEPAFIAMLINSDYGRFNISQISVESTRLRVGLGDFKQLKFITPPLLEQRTILAALQPRLAQMDALMDKTANSIALLKERRSALITAAVTGQIDLRESV